jgi:hypothetical protein
MPHPCQTYLDQQVPLRQALAAASRQAAAALGGHTAAGPAPEGSDKGAEIGAATQNTRDLNAQIEKLQEQYNQCRLAHGGLPDLVENALDATLSITWPIEPALIVYTVEPGVQEALSFPVRFNAYEHKTWEIDLLPSAPFFRYTSDTYPVTMLLTGQTGSFNPATGHIALGLWLSLEYGSVWVDNASIGILLSSANAGGSPMSRTAPHKCILKGSATIKQTGIGYNPDSGSTVHMTLAFGVATYP